MTFVQDGAPPHTAKATQSWCSKNLPNFIAKEEWPANSPGINPIENLWSIIDEEAYKDPIPKRMKELKRRLKEACMEKCASYNTTRIISLDASTAKKCDQKQGRSRRLLKL